MESSSVVASSENRWAGSSIIESNRFDVTVSPNTEAVSATVSGVPWW